MLPALASLIAETRLYSQIWLTSHSPELATLIEKQRSFSLYQLSMTEGETRVERLGESQWARRLFFRISLQ